MPGKRTLRILLVDDERELVATFQDSVQALGYHVGGTDPTHALAVARDEPPDVVVLGLVPGDDRVFELIRAFREQPVWRKPLVIAIACPGYLDVVGSARKSEAHLVLMRPVNVALLSGVLCRFEDLLNSVEAPDAEAIDLDEPEATDPVVYFV